LHLYLEHFQQKREPVLRFENALKQRTRAFSLTFISMKMLWADAASGRMRMSEDTPVPVPGKPAPHLHEAGERCSAPGPWFSFGLTCGLAVIVALLAYGVRALL
jgi:hypothetical protein